ncbi:MAG: hypothetical protein ACREVO_20935 [Steroidobacteraceae bacterium]
MNAVAKPLRTDFEHRVFTVELDRNLRGDRGGLWADVLPQVPVRHAGAAVADICMAR